MFLVDTLIKGATFIGGKVVDNLDKSDERQHQEIMLDKKGKIESDLIEKRSNAECARINTQGNIDLKKQKLTNEREKQKDACRKNEGYRK